MLTKYNVRAIILARFTGKHYLRNKKSLFEYNEVTPLVGAWSNTIRPKGLYDRFDHTPTVMITPIKVKE